MHIRLDHISNNFPLNMTTLLGVPEKSQFPETSQKGNEAQFMACSVVQSLGTSESAKQVADYFDPGWDSVTSLDR